MGITKLSTLLLSLLFHHGVIGQVSHIMPSASSPYQGSSNMPFQGTVSGTYPHMSSNMWPPMSSGMHPPMSSGLYQPTNPYMSSGMYPPMSSGMYPPMSSGMYPPMSSGMYPHMSSGMYPPTNPYMTSGMYPPMSSGMYPPMSSGMYPHMSSGMYPPMSSGTYPHMSSGMYPPMSSGMYPPMSSGMYPPMSSGMYPPMSSGMYPPMSSGMYPHMSSGMYPPMSSGMYPPMSSGMYPPMSSGMYPPMSSGMYPHMSSGMYPPMSSGMYPHMSSGMYPPMSSGMYPHMSSGMYPPMSSGMYPHMSSGMYPPMSSGMYPPMSSGMYPPMSSAMYPHMSSGMYPPMSSGMYPHMSSGMYPPMSSGMYPPMSSGMYPPMSSGMYPPMSSGMYPPMSSAMYPHMSSGMYPPISSAMYPHMSSGMYPPMSSGMYPPMSSGMYPPMSSGMYPHMSSGMYPPMSSGMYPPISSGMYPPMSSGMYPPMSSAMYPHMSSGMYPPMSSGMYPHMSSGMYPPMSSGMYPPMSSGMYPPMSSGMYPPMSSGMYPPMSSGIYPPMSSGMYPPMSSGMYPPMSSGMYPPMSSGMYPPMSSGMYPPMSSGMYPPMSSGMYPPMSSGMYPPMSSGMYPPMSSGMNPPMSSGMYPPMSSGMYPPMSSGMYPPMSSGMYPPMSSGMYPPMSSGMYPANPHMSSGMYPPMSSGIYPPMSSGIYPPMSSGIYPTNLHMSSGMYPPMSSGMYPPMSSGMYPPMSSGVNPPMSSVVPGQPSAPTPSAPVATCVTNVNPKPCPSSCPSCYGTVDCYAYDAQGTYLNCPEIVNNQTLSEFYNNASSLDTFDSNSVIGTCERLKRHLNSWIAMGQGGRDNFVRLFKNPASVPVSEIGAMPTALFAFVNMTGQPSPWQTFMNSASRVQKLKVAEKVQESGDCEIKAYRQDLYFEGLYRDSLASGDITEDYATDTFCEAYLADDCVSIPPSKWEFALQYTTNCPWTRLDCLPDVSMSSFSNTTSLSKVRSLCSGSGSTTDGSADVLGSMLSSYLDNTAISYSCDSDYLKVVEECCLDPDYVISHCTSSELTHFTPCTQYTDIWGSLLSTVGLDFTTMDSNDITSMLPSLDMSDIEQMNKTSLISAVCTQNAMDGFDVSEIDMIMDTIFSEMDFSVPSEKACLAKYDPNRAAENSVYTDSELASQFQSGTIDAALLSHETSERIWNEVKNTVTSDAALLTNAALAVQFDSAVYDSIAGDLSANTIEAITNSMGTQEGIPPSNMVSFVDKALSSTGGLEALLKSSSEEVVEFIPLKSLEDMSINDIPFLSGSERLNATIPESQCKVMMEKVESANTALTKSYVENLQPMMGAASKSMFDKVPQNSDYVATMSLIAESQTITYEKIQYVSTKILNIVAAGSTTASDIALIPGNVLAVLSDTQINSLGGSCNDFVTKLKANDYSKLNRKGVKKAIKAYAATCVGSTSTITQSHTSRLGNITELYDETDVAKMDRGGIKAAAKIAKNKYLCWSTVQAFASRYQAVAVTGSMTKSDVTYLGSLAVGLDSATLSAIPNLCDCGKSVFKSIKKRRKQKKKYFKRGFQMDCDDGDEDSFNAGVRTFVTTYLSSCSPQAAGRRRRRSVVGPTCTQMTSMGSSALSALTTDQMAAILDAEFKSCVSLLGTPDDYSTSQLSTLAIVAQRTNVYGAPSTWSSTTIRALGSINQGLSDTELSGMNFTYDDVSKLGSYSSWTDSQKTLITSTKWLTDYKSGNAATITSSELRSFGHMTCGLSTSQIQQLTVYAASADAVGAVTSCSELQMVEFANLAKAAYGSTVANWTSIQITSVGVHIGGLSKTELATLTETQIDNIDPSHVTYIPSTVFSGFTSTQLSSMSASQAQATTSTQRSTLSSEQLSALSTAAGVTFTPASGVGRVEISWITTMMGLILLILTRQ